MPAKLDLYAKHKAEYVASRKPALFTMSPARYLAIEGASVPGAPEFQAAVGALYNVAFTVKMARKFAGRDYTVSKLEGLWWDPSPADAGPSEQRWHWQLMIRVPPFLTAVEVKRAITQLVAKGKPAEVKQVKLMTLREGRVVQMLHVGPYDKERPTLDAMHAHATAHKRKVIGKHHEIYLSDPRRVAPAKLRTILRLGVK